MRALVTGWRAAALWLVAAVALALGTYAVFDRAYPLVDVGLRLGREEAIARARALVRERGLDRPDARTAAEFATDDELSTYVDFAAGGPDSVRALATGRDLPLYTWAVRFFVPGDPREVVVRLAPDGAPLGFRRTLAEDDRRPDVGEAAGRAAADAALARWGGGAPDWRFVSASFETQPRSGRVDRTFRYERTARRVGEAPIRLDVVVTGDTARPPAVPNVAAGAASPGAAAAAGARAELLGVRRYAAVPETWTRRYGEMRASNDFYAQLSTPGILLFAVGAVGALVRWRGQVRWRPALLVGGVVGALMGASILNQLPVAWFGYDTATSPGSFVAQLVIGAIGAGVGAALLVGGSVAAAELLTRRAFPRQHDWYGYLAHRGAGPIAARVAGGYALAALGFAYVSLFYLATRTSLGWWVPTGSLDDPNQIATPLPWVSAIGTALFAGIWEECVFRAVPLAILSLWVGNRPGRRWWLAAGVVVTALVFGFGHANYPSWPAYARGVELFVEAALWAVLYLTAGLPVTIVAHVLYDLVWFGLFAAHGDGAAYRTTLAIVVAAGVLPLALVVQGGLARRRRVPAGVPNGVGDGVAVDDAPRFGEWRPRAQVAAAPRDEGLPEVVERVPLARDRRRAFAALGILALAVPWALDFDPGRNVYGPAFTASRARVGAVADSALRAAGADPARWARTLVVRQGGLEPELRAFLRDSVPERSDRKDLQRRLATTYAPGPLWEARYVRRTGTVAERAESWLVIVRPDGKVRKRAHTIPEAAPGDTLTREAARATALAAVRALGLDPAHLRELGVTLVPRPARVDALVEWEDRAVGLPFVEPLPGGAVARVRVAVVGREAVDVSRDVKLPEGWERARRERESREGVLAALAGLAVAGIFLTLVGRALRRAPREEVPTARARLGRGGAVVVGLAGVGVFLLSGANGVERLLAGWPTEQPWTTYLTTTAIGLLLAAATAGLLLGGGWSLLDALRRRAGLPWVPSDVDGLPGVRAAAVAGFVLAAAPFGVGGVLRQTRRHAWPEPPTSSLDVAVPWLADVPAPLLGALTQPLLLVPVLGALLVVRGARARIALVLLLGALVGVAWPDADSRVLLILGGVLAASGAAALVWAYGRGSVLAWAFAGAFGAALGAARGVVVAANGTERLASLVGLLAAVATVVALWRLVPGWAVRAEARGAVVVDASAEAHAELAPV